MPNLVSAASQSTHDLPSRRSLQSYADRTLAVRRGSDGAGAPSGPMAPPPRAPRSEAGGAIARTGSSSRSTTAGMRRHQHHALHGRTARSSIGAAGYNPQNEFPVFGTTGDVEILIKADGQERRYVLHRLILAQNSGFFAASTSEAWRRAQADTTKKVLDAGAKADDESGSEGRPSLDRAVGLARLPAMLRYELDWGSDDDQNADEVPMLVQKAPQSSLFGGGNGDSTALSRPQRTKTRPPPASSNALFRSLGAIQTSLHLPGAQNAYSSEDDGDEPSDTIRDYDNLFRIFYNHAPALDALDITEAYIQSKTLLALADQYDAVAVVGPRVDHHLLTFQSRLWKQVAKYPPSYLRLGFAARSRAIFQEALVHVVGQWPAGASQLKTVPDAVHDLIEDKAADLEDLKARVEARLFRLCLGTRHGERVSHSGAAWWDWQANALFRGWLADNCAPDTALISPTPRNQAALPTPPPRNSSSRSRDGVRGATRVATATTAPPAAPPGTALVPAPASGPAVRFADQVAPMSTLLAAPLVGAPGRVFRLIGLGGPAYLGHDECKRFVRAVPGEHSRDTIRRFERRLDELKDAARETVRPLLRNGLELDVGAMAGLGYLTCTRVEEGEWPW